MKIPDKPPFYKEIIRKRIMHNPEHMLDLISSSKITDEKGRYVHWDKLKYLPLPENEESHEIWWTKIKYARNNHYKKLLFKGTDDNCFKYLITDDFYRDFHFLDQNTAGSIGLEKTVMNSHLRNTYLISSLYEESITSSQLEGASTTRDIAKRMLREGRPARDKHELMILNNFKAMQFIRLNKDEALTPEFIKEVHRIISDNTLDDMKRCGEYRDVDDNINIVVDNDTVVFTPPHYTEIDNRINELCAFANTNDSSREFIHPVIKSIIIHFCLSYIHPFVDGNGRTARALFYWYMLKQGYWLFEFISISRILKNSPVQYGLSYLYTETDDNDLTYFIDYQLKVIKQSIEALQTYIKRKISDLESVEKIIRSTKLSNKLNIRQISIIKHAIKKPGYIYKIMEHKNTHDIAYDTARKDLLALARYNLLVKVKEGKSFMFIAPSNIEERLKEF